MDEFLRSCGPRLIELLRKNKGSFAIGPENLNNREALELAYLNGCLTALTNVFPERKSEVERYLKQKVVGNNIQIVTESELAGMLKGNYGLY